MTLYHWSDRPTFDELSIGEYLTVIFLAYAEVCCPALDLSYHERPIPPDVGHVWGEPVEMWIVVCANKRDVFRYAEVPARAELLGGEEKLNLVDNQCCGWSDSEECFQSFV